MPTRSRLFSTFTLLAAGLAMWWVAGGLETNRLAPLIAGVIVGGICLVLGGDSGLDRFNRSTSRRLGIIAPMVGLIAAGSLYVIAVLRHRDFFPLLHDEFAYLLQARMLAGGRLWLAEHPLADFFETFFVFVRPVYSSIYFPGTGLLNVPAVWLDLPTWIIPLLVSSAIVALLYCIIAEICDPAAALLAAVLLISLDTFRGTSIMVMSHPAMALLGLGMIFAWLRWRRTRRSMVWALALGALAGWAAVTRPADALAYGIAVAGGLLLDLRGQPLRGWFMTAALILLAAAPFLFLQIAFDRGVTGRSFYTPYKMYLDREQPQTQFSFVGAAARPGTGPASALPGKRAYYTDFLAPELGKYQSAGPVRVWAEHRWRLVVQALFPHPALLALVPVGLLGLHDRRRWVLAATLPLAVLLYSFNPVFLQWYTLTWLPAAILLVVLGIERLCLAFQRPSQVRAALIVCVATIAVGSILAAPKSGPENLRSPILTSVRQYELHQPPGSRQVLLFGHASADNVHADPVFNITTAWPDDATIIRARDLGAERNRELVEYFARHQPDRQIITIDMRTGDSRNHGPAGEAITRWPDP